MAMHLFSTPIECTNCGTVVSDPKLDHCPNCNALLKERRQPGRLAGVEKRYGNLRFLLAALRFLAVITAVVGILLFLFGLGDETIPWSVNLLILLGSVVGAVAIFALVALFQVIMDIEENTRASFRVQQQLLDELHRGKQSPSI